MRCLLEGREFPDDEFEETTEHGTVHRRGRPHTILGDYIDEGGLPDAEDAIPEDEDHD